MTNEIQLSFEDFVVKISLKKNYSKQMAIFWWPSNTISMPWYDSAWKSIVRTVWYTKMQLVLTIVEIRISHPYWSRTSSMVVSPADDNVGIPRVDSWYIADFIFLSFLTGLSVVLTWLFLFDFSFFSYRYPSYSYSGWVRSEVTWV